jgi:hypothetical protein
VKVRDCVAAKAIHRAIAQEPDPPAPHMWYGFSAQQKRRVLAAEPSEDLGGHAWLGPGLNLARMNNTAVAETGFERRARPTLHNCDVVPALVQEIGGRNPDNSGSNDDRFHKCARYSARRIERPAPTAACARKKMRIESSILCNVPEHEARSVASP